MAGFKGQAENSIDDKGRVALPAKMRRALSPEAKETFVATRGLERCVFLYPLDVWERVEDQIGSLNTFQRETRDFTRNILRWAEETTLDGQGRISLTKNLLDFAGLSAGNGAKALFIGALDHIEVWDPDVFDAYLNEQPEEYETVAERVMGGL
ncbi:MAG TPA: division/cell wall cluster transcriptional repressor MraZ [Rubricoccaceae bacterium]|nr:division/cell wall cluster transcriptional repressor MraZ [Rubricoccaceae bacterium]